MREVRVAGRLVSLRLMGKAGFAHLQGAGKRIQIYVKKDVVGEPGFQLFHLLDLGDSIGVEGHLFRTKTNELSIWVEKIFFLSKALLPLPEKWHGLSDVEVRYRQRYLDLIANEESRQVFVTRARIIKELRRFFDARGYIEVETPMMHPIPGGAAELDFSKMQRLSMREAIGKYWPAGAGEAPTREKLAAPGGAQEATNRYNLWAKGAGAPYAAAKGPLQDGQWTGLLFETMAEDQ